MVKGKVFIVDGGGGGSHQRHLEESGTERQNSRLTTTSSLDLAMREAEAKQGGRGKTYREEE